MPNNYRSCLWGLIITRLIWPISARQKFKDGLSLLWLRMSLIWKRDPLAILLDGTQPSNAYLDLREEFELHSYHSKLESLRGSASSEIDLRGPFPDKAYGRILKSTGDMLDAFHAMNVVISKDPRATKGEAEMLRYTADERVQLCSRISHLFQGTLFPLACPHLRTCINQLCGRGSPSILPQTRIPTQPKPALHGPRP